MLTRESILAMEPGRELDVLVEERVFGKKIRWMQDEWSDPVPVSGDHGYIIDKYSTDLSDAWEVVEKFHEVSVKRFETMKGHRYWCKIELNYDGDIVIAQGEQPPEAIVKAALLTTISGEDNQ